MAMETASHAFSEALGEYHPRLERLLFGVAMIGLLVVAHLQIQKSQDFEGGCGGMGLSAEAGGGGGGGEALLDCAAVTSGMGSELLGVSNVIWGFAFYVVVAALTAGLLWGGVAVRRWLRGARLALIGGGAAYSLYLTVLQVGYLEGLCLPCLGSAAAVGGLCGCEGAMLLGEGEGVTSGKTWDRQASVFARGVAIALLLSGANMAFSWGALFEPEDAMTGEASAGKVEARCRLEEKTPIADQGKELVNRGDITLGSEGADVTVIEYFDPNCPHCRSFHEVMMGIVRGYREEVQFVFKPYPLAKESLPEIGALYAAHRRGKFKDMLGAQYERQKETGEISIEDVQAISDTIGLDATSVLRAVSTKGYRVRAIKNVRRGQNVGVDRVPTVLINGHFAGTRRGRCLAAFIEAAKRGELQPGKTYRSK